MNETWVIDIARNALQTMMLVSGPLLMVSLVVGLLVSVFQALTQINESTLTFIPKMVAVLVVLTVMAPWMLEVLQQYTIDVFGNVGNVIR